MKEPCYAIIIYSFLIDFSRDNTYICHRLGDTLRYSNELYKRESGAKPEQCPLL